MPRDGARHNFGDAQTTGDGMPTGTVKWVDTTKGYGFIAPDDGGEDLFVHISAVERSGLTGRADNQKPPISGRSEHQVRGAMLRILRDSARRADGDWSGRRESNPYHQLGRLRSYHYTTPAQS